MFKDISFVTLAFFYINILGYVFHSVVSRSLGPVGYGEFMVLYSFMLTVGNITGLLGTVSIKTIVENFDRKYEFLRSLRLMGALLGIIFAISVSALSPILRDFLHVSSSFYFFIIALVWLGMFIISVERSFLQSIGKFPLFALCNSAELTLRLIFAIVLLYFGFKVGGVLFSSFIGLFIVLLFLFWFNGEITGIRAKLSIKKMLKIAFYVSPSGFFVYADDIFIRRIFDEHTAGLFASVSIVGKVLVWLTLNLLGVYFPKFVGAKGRVNLKKFIFQMFGLIVLAELGAQFVVFLIGKPLFLLLFGTKFEAAFQFLQYYLLAVLPLLFAVVFISIATALEKGFFLIYLHLFCFYLGFLVFSFKGIDDYLNYIFILNMIFVLVYILFFRGNLFVVNKNSRGHSALQS